MPPQRLSRHIEARDGLIVVTVSGTLDAAAGPALFRPLAQCLTREPVGILVNLSGMTVAESASANIFSKIVQQAEIWPGTPLLLCAPEPATATLIRNGAASMAVFDTVADSHTALAAGEAPVSELILPSRVRPVAPVTSSPKRACAGTCLTSPCRPPWWPASWSPTP